MIKLQRFLGFFLVLIALSVPANAGFVVQPVTFFSAYTAPSLLPGNSNVLLFGDSLNAHGVYNSTTSGSEESSFWSRNYMNWSQMLDPRGYYEQWYDTTYTGKYSNGLNKGLSGDTTGGMYNRLADIDRIPNVKIVAIDGGTNDIDKNDVLSTSSGAPLGNDGSGIENNLRAIYNDQLAHGRKIIIETVPPRATSGTNAWLPGSGQAAEAASLATWEQVQADADPTHIQIVRWDQIGANADGSQKAGYYESDQLHWTPLGGYHVATDAAGFDAKLANWISPFTSFPADVVSGDLWPNPTFSGTGGSVGTGVTGTVADSTRIATTGTGATVVASKDTINGYTAQKAVITLDGTGGAPTVTIGYINTTQLTTLPAVGTWVKPWYKIKTLATGQVTAVAGQLRQQPTAGNMINYAMRVDTGNDWPNVALQTAAGDGVWIAGNAMQIRANATYFLQNVVITLDNSASGTVTVWVERMHNIPVTDPRPGLGFDTSFSPGFSSGFH